MGVPTGKLKVLVLESGGNSWPDEFVLSVKNPGHDLRNGQREEGQRFVGQENVYNNLQKSQSGKMSRLKETEVPSIAQECEPQAKTV